MTDVHSKKQRSYNMSKIRSKNTKPEIMLRENLKKYGVKTRNIKHKVYGNPDIVFYRKKVAVFIDGCFWHKCPKCFIEPKNNAAFWRKKLDGNVKRDKKVNRVLKKEGWKVIRFREHQIRENPKKCIDKIINILNS